MSDPPSATTEYAPVSTTPPVASHDSPQVPSDSPHRLPEKGPADTCSAYSFMTFAFGHDLLSLGNERPLQPSDLPPIPARDDTPLLSSTLTSAWSAELHSSSSSSPPSLWRAIYSAHRAAFWCTGAFTIGEHVCMVLQPVFLSLFVSWLSSPSPSVSKGLLWAASLTLTNYVQACLHHQVYYMTMRGGWNLRIALTIMTHNKLLKLNTASASSQGGVALNLISTDVFRFDNFMPGLWHYLTGPLDAVAVLVLLTYQLTFLPALAGILVVVLDVLLKLYLGKKIGKIRSTTAKLTDSRVAQTKELLRGIETVKSYSWESHFSSKLLSRRDLEHHSIFTSQLLKGVNFACVLATPAIASLVMFGLYIALHGDDPEKQLTVEIALSAMAFVAVLRTSIGKELSRATENGPECNTAVRRFQEFLMLPETEEKADEKEDDDKSSDGGGDKNLIEMRGASFSWPSDPTSTSTPDPSSVLPEESPAPPPPSCLTDLNVTLARGELMVVIGPVGCGKSALVNAICGELRTTGGSKAISSRSKIGLAAQSPFVAVGSFRSNLTFGSADQDQAFYDSVVAGCQLEADLKMLPDGDATMLGEQGVNLSGGQRARLGMARAIYSKPDILLLDDPLAAVDPEVRGKLFECIRGPLCSGSATVLVTHHSHVASMADKVLVLGEGGVVLKYGSPKECESFFEYESPPKVSKKSRKKVEEEKPMPPPPPAAEAAPVPAPAPAKRFVSKETKVTGLVDRNTYLNYFKAGGTYAAPIVLVLMTLGQVGIVYSDYFLLDWCGDNDSGGDTSKVVVYALLTAGTVLLSYVRTAYFFRASLLASSSLHSNMLRRVIKAPMGWFHRNPLGRITNRFSADQGQVDEQLAVVMFDTIQVFFIALAAMIVAGVSLPYILIVLPPLAYYIVKLRSFVTTCTRELKRFEGMSRSPCYETVTVTMNGLTTIRAFGRSEAQSESLVQLIDANARAWYWWLIGNRYIGFRLDMVTVVLVGFSSIMAVVLIAADVEVSATMIGLSLTYIISLSGNLQFMVRQSALVENFMTSVERVIDFGVNTPQEREGEGGEGGGEWNDVGELRAENASMRYSPDDPLVLSGVSFSCKQGDNVGICGRTGAGKSSFVNCLLRLTSLEEDGGKIMLGSEDVSKVPLSKLRNAVTLIPQSPVLFDGDVRYNVDPCGLYSDGDIKKALLAVNLGDALTLDTQVGMDGDNLSVGQQQLLSLARAALRRSKLVVLDEPTANVDQETDVVIRRMMNEGGGGGGGDGGEVAIGDFSKSTVVTIAHRVQSIVDCDVVVVLGAGKVLETGRGRDLAAKKGGIFAGMVDK